METFSIICTTCKSRLKVRSTAAIGQVVPCPKCGGMVMVKLPEEGVPPEVANAATKPVEQQAAHASPHNTKEFDDVEAILTGTAPAPLAAPPRNERPLGDGELKTPAGDREITNDKASTSPTPGQPQRTTAPATGEQPKPTAAALPPSPEPKRPRSYWGWLAISILAGVFLAVAVVVVSGWFLRDGVSVIAALPDAAKSPKETEPASTPNAATTSTPEKTSVPTTKTDLKQAEPEKASAPPVDDRAQADADPPAQSKNEDPVGIAGPTKTPAKSDPPPMPSDDPLGKFADVLKGGSDDPLPTAKAPAATEGPAAEAPADAPVKPTLPRPPPRAIDVKARLADPLPGIDVPGVPLADFLAELSQLSTIPITLRPEGLALVGASPLTPVSLKAENTTVGKALTGALAPLHLEYAIEEDQLMVSLSGKLSDRSLRMDDLTSNSEEESQRLAEWGTALADPGVWKDGDEEGATLTPGLEQFAVRASDRTYASLLLLYEKLRVARGLAPRTQRAPELFRLESRSARAQEKLATPITLNFSHPTLLVKILDRLQETAKVQILVDWQALAAEGWNPDGEVTMVVETKPLSEALDVLLTPMDLTWRAVDEQTFQVTSAAALPRLPELELYAAGDLASDAAGGEALLARLRSALADHAPDRPGAPMVPVEDDDSGLALRFDPVSRCILAYVPQLQQRQIERLLVEWRGEVKAAAR